jgi:hypothetical protein
MSRFHTRLEGLDFKLHPKKPMAFCSTATETKDLAGPSVIP